jgi:hypothetical protein
MYNKPFLMLVAISSILLIVGCANLILTQGGQMVRQMQPDFRNQCKFLGNHSVDSSGFQSMSHAQEYRNTHTKMKNRVAELGGNAYLITSEFFGGMVAVIDLEVYNCTDMQ